MFKYEFQFMCNEVALKSFNLKLLKNESNDSGG